MNLASENQFYWDNLEAGRELVTNEPILSLLVGLHLLKSNNPSSSFYQDTIFAFCTGIEHVSPSDERAKELGITELLDDFLNEYFKPK